MFRLYLVFGFGGSKGHVKIAILALVSFLSICGCDNSLSITIPLISSVFSIESPGFPTILIKSKFTSLRSKSATDRTASTAI